MDRGDLRASPDGFDEVDLHEAKAGDADALERLLEAVGPDVRATLSISPKWRSVIDSDDVMQVTYMEAFVRIAQFAGTTERSFRRWLTQIARRNLLDGIRSLERVKRSPVRGRVVGSGSDDSYIGLCEIMAATSTTPSRVVSGQEARTLIEEALARMPARYVAAIRHFDLDGVTGPEAAVRLGCSRVTAFMLRARARDRLRELLGSGSDFLSRLA